MNAAIKLPLAEGAERTGVRRAAVIGAGSMGSGIAAQFANAGIAVDLLDIAGGGPSSRHAPARAGIDRQLKAGGFMHDEAASLVRPGNIEDDLGRLAEADWIVEAIVERLDAKRDLYRAIDSVRRPGSIVSSNTSTIPRAALVAGMGETFGRDFLITHFFNPPRSMQLVEIVSTPGNNPAVVTKAKAGCEALLGKTVVECRDTPGFIANRIGCHWLAVAAIEAVRSGLTVEEADAVMASFGVPRTGVFGLLDLIGIDLVPQVWGSLMATLPANDDIHAADLPGQQMVRNLVTAGRLGRKAKAGFYRLGSDRSRQALDLVTGEYRAERPLKPADLPGGGRDLAALLASTDRLGRYAWAVLSRVIAYAAEHASSIASDIGAVDTAMMLGYAWRHGPFRLADTVGIGTIESRLTREGRTVPTLLSAAARIGGFYDASGTPLASDGSGRVAEAAAAASALTAAKQTGQQLFGNEAASLWDLGGGVACLELHTKMNSFAPAVLDMIEHALVRGGSAFDALVVGNDDARGFLGRGRYCGHARHAGAQGVCPIRGLYQARSRPIPAAEIRAVPRRRGCAWLCARRRLRDHAACRRYRRSCRVDRRAARGQGRAHPCMGRLHAASAAGAAGAPRREGTGRRAYCNLRDDLRRDCFGLSAQGACDRPVAFERSDRHAP